MTLHYRPRLPIGRDAPPDFEIQSEMESVMDILEQCWNQRILRRWGQHNLQAVLPPPIKTTVLVVEAAREIDAQAFRRYSAPASTRVITFGHFGIGHIAGKRDGLGITGAILCARICVGGWHWLHLQALLRNGWCHGRDRSGFTHERGSPVREDGFGSAVSFTQPASTPA